MQLQEAQLSLKSMANPGNVAGMARFGINSSNTLGVSLPEIERLAKQVGKDHLLAVQLWESGIHESRLLACMVDDPHLVTELQAETWVNEFDSWDICDQCCSRLLDKLPFAWEKAFEWTGRREEFVKRGGFVMIAALSVHDKKAADDRFIKFFPVIKQGSFDDRNFVKKAVNWALRQIGKRNMVLNRAAIECAREIQKFESKSSRWIAADALRELQSEKVLARLKKQNNF